MDEAEPVISAWSIAGALARDGSAEAGMHHVCEDAMKRKPHETSRFHASIWTSEVGLAP